MPSVVELYNRVVVCQSPPSSGLRQIKGPNDAPNVPRRRGRPPKGSKKIAPKSDTMMDWFQTTANFTSSDVGSSTQRGGRTTRNSRKTSPIPESLFQLPQVSPKYAATPSDIIEIPAPTPAQSVQVKLELGHSACLRDRPTADGHTHDWNVFVRGPEGSNIQHFVEKVVFHLHESFPKPKRVVKEPPYQLAESGYGSFLLPIEIYFKNKEDPRKIKFDYDLFLHLEGTPPVKHTRCEKLTFQNPTPEFSRKLLKAGGVSIPSDTVATTTLTPPKAAAPPPPPTSFENLFGAPLKSDTSSKVKKHAKKSSSQRSPGADSSSTSKSQPAMESTPRETPSNKTPLLDVVKKEDQTHKTPKTDERHRKQQKEHGSSSSSKRPAESSAERSHSSKKHKKDKDKESSSSQSSRSHKDSHSSKAKEQVKVEVKSEHHKEHHHKSKHREREHLQKSSQKPVAKEVSNAPVVPVPTPESRKSVSHKSHHIASKPSAQEKTKKSPAASVIATGQGTASPAKSQSSQKRLVPFEDELSTGEQSDFDPFDTPPQLENEVDKNNDSFIIDVVDTNDKTSESEDEEDKCQEIFPSSKKETVPPRRPSTEKEEPAKPVNNPQPSYRPELKTKAAQKAPAWQYSMQSESSQERKDIGKENKNDVSPKDLVGKNKPEAMVGPDLKAPNGETFLSLLELQEQLMCIHDTHLLAKVVRIIQETNLYQVSEAFFNFDLCSLDGPTVQRIKSFLANSTTVGAH